jgi:hypothetical protein
VNVQIIYQVIATRIIPVQFKVIGDLNTPTNVFRLVLEDDPWDSSNPNNGSPNGSGGTTSGGDNGSEPDDSSITTVLGPNDETSEQKEKTKYESLKQLVENDSLGSNILPIVNQLRTKLGPNDNKWSVSYRNRWIDGNKKNVPDDDGIQERPSRTRSHATTGTAQVGQIHTHPEDTYAVFSWLDIKLIGQFYNNSHADFNAEIFLIAVSPNNVTYALKVDNIETLNLKISSDLTSAEGTTDDENERNLMKDMKDKYNKSVDLEKTFLQLYGDYGISFYKATDANLSNWEQLELDLDESNEEIIIPTSCN